MKPVSAVTCSRSGCSNDLIDAAKFGNLEMVKELLQQPGIDVNKAVRYYVGFTPLIEAAQNRWIEIVRELLKHPKILVNQADNYGFTALMRASYYGHSEIAELLLQQPGIDVNKATNDGATALILATDAYYNAEVTYREITMTPELLVQMRFKIVYGLLQKPEIDVNEAAEDGYTALINASRFGYYDIVRLLLQQPGINVNKVCYKGRTALDWALIGGHSDIVELLNAKINYQLAW